MSERHSEAAFETVIEAHLLANGYATVNRDGLTAAGDLFRDSAGLHPNHPAEGMGQPGRGAHGTERTIVLLKEHCTALIAAVMTGRITIRESTEDNLHGKCGGKMRC